MVEIRSIIRNFKGRMVDYRVRVDGENDLIGRFMDNLQTEVLEIEFMEFSHGFKTISDLDFTELLLRYTDFDRNTKKSIVRRVKKMTSETNVCPKEKTIDRHFHQEIFVLFRRRIQGITFEQFKQFFAFLNNLEEFNIAMRFHQLSNKPISQGKTIGFVQREELFVLQRNFNER